MIRLPYMRWRGKYCPIVEVEMRNNDKELRTLAYVDTGATYSVFHSDFCDELDLSLRNGKRIDITVGDGGIIPVYIHKVNIRIETLKITCDIGFSDRLGTGINILGRESLIDDYIICFDGKNKEVRWHI